MRPEQYYYYKNSECMKSLPSLIKKWITVEQTPDHDPPHKIVYQGGPVYTINPTHDPEWAAALLLCGLEQREECFYNSAGHMVAGMTWIHVRDMYSHLEEYYARGEAV